MSRTPTKGGRTAVLELVKRESPVTAEALAASLGVTGMAVRQHLDALQKLGLVEYAARAGKRGRPSKVWRTTKEGDSRFADSHAALAVELIGQMRDCLGEETLKRLIALRTVEQERTYAPTIPPMASLKSRLERLASIRSREGYMAEVKRDGPGTWLFLEHHCPICAAARACSGLCREELTLFQRVLGDKVRVERVSHILAGADRCAYRVTPASGEVRLRAGASCAEVCDIAAPPQPARAHVSPTAFRSDP
jgi:predicted ArsR family transcriptional regulator